MFPLCTRIDPLFRESDKLFHECIVSYSLKVAFCRYI